MIVGVIGGGQLARMLALAGLPLGLRFVFLDPAPDACAATVGEHLCGNYDDENLLARLAQTADVVTYEFENVPEQSLESLAGQVAVHPSALALATTRDRLREKTLFRELGIPTPAFVPVDSLADLKQAIAEIGLPAVLKTRRMGYDGKGQVVLRHGDDLEAAWQQLGAVPLIVERFVAFQREVSVLGVRDRSGATRFYPLAENVHHGGILHLSRARAGDPMEATARNYTKTMLDHLNYVGVMALELFQCGDELLANEVAPRVHNTGHWTIEGAETSQFENHLRAILDLPLGSTDPVGHTAMVNLIGTLPTTADILALPNTHLHLYDKPPRSGRKLGHVTVRASDEKELEAGLERLEQAGVKSRFD